MTDFEKDFLVPEGKVHVDEWLDTPAACVETGEEYARWVLEQMRFEAWKLITYQQFIRRHALFCTWEGQRLRVTCASRLGTIGLQRDFTLDTGYQYSAWVNDCILWGAHP